MAQDAARIHLSDAQRDELESLARRRKTARIVAFRARIILACAKVSSDSQVARDLHTTRTTVGCWRKRFIEKGVDGLHDEPRSGAPRTITDEIVERVVTTTLETQPEGATHWSTRSLAKKLGVSHSAVMRIWHAFGLQPHRSGTFTLSNDPLLVEKVRDIVGLYMNPPANALVLCVDEKSQIQAVNRSQPIIPMQLGQVELRTHDYKRHGTTTLFAALNVATGNVIGKCLPKHRTSEFLKFLDLIDASAPSDLDVHLVLDNYTTHKTAAVKNWLLKRPRYHLHFTPTYSSWLNQVERWFALLTEKQIKRGSHTSVKQLEQAIQKFLDAHNQDPKAFVWTKGADQILHSIARFASTTAKLACEEITDTPH
jgi:transposase